MKLIFANSFLFIFYLFGLTQSLEKSLIDANFQYAVKLFNEEKYFDAVTEFKRTLFFDTENKFSFESNIYIGLSYKHGGFFDLAEKFFNDAFRCAKNSDDILLAKLELLKLFLLSRNEPKAQTLLFELTSRYVPINKQLHFESGKDFSYRFNEIIYWNGFSQLYFNHPQIANSFLRQLRNTTDSYYPFAKELLSITDSVIASQKSERTALILSYILPGAGQFYLGEYISGLISFIWNSLWLYLSIDAFTNKREFDGIMILSLLWFRFYSGNIQNTSEFAQNFNSKVLNKWLNYLQNDFKGSKP